MFVTSLIVSCLFVVVSSVRIPRNTTYNRPAGHQYYFGGSPKSQTMRSKIECASHCAINEICVTFNFDEHTNMCTMNTGAGQFYGQTRRRDCPKDNGYKLYKKDSIELCLKFVANKETKYKASSNCQDDGGHLLLIENEAMYKFVIDLLDETASGNSWIEGEEKSSQFWNYREYLSWRGDPIPYFKWHPDDPNQGFPSCIRLQRLYGFLFRDNPCTAEYSYFCQM